MWNRVQTQKGNKAMRPVRTFRFVFLCLLLIAALPVWGIGAAVAQQQEKRIALVVGDGAYSKGQLATAANDAGLIAQTLQAAGFDVVGARDLDGDTLRKSFHDFIQKAQNSGPNTVAMVYLSGYGVQMTGENYFIPVDADVNRDTDVPTEGLRISDYTRQLAGMPLKASIFVLDAARQQPFVEGGQQQIASGLALVDPENNQLIAFNAAPGTVAPTEQGPYGIYAQSLAEMIRTGGLALPDVFDRLRLRVNENSKGAQMPWDAQKIQAQFTFFDRGPDAPPPQATPDQVASIRTRPIRSMSVQDAYAAAVARDTLQGYQDFVLGFPSDPLAGRVRAIIAARREAIIWRRSYLADTPQAYWTYLRRYPDGPHAWDCHRRLTFLSAALEPPPSFAMVDYDVPPPPPEEMVIVDRPVIYFGDPVFAFAPPPPPPVFFLPPPPPDFVVLAPPFAPVGLFILPQLPFVAMPAFVVAPAYVAPPPNNIIFNNIHNTTVINNVINQPPPAVPAGNPAAAAAAAANPTPVGATTPAPPIVQAQAKSIQQNPQQQLSPHLQAAVASPTTNPGKLAVPAKATTAATQPTTISPQHSLSTTAPLKGTSPALTAPAGTGAAGAGTGARLAPGTTQPIQSGTAATGAKGTTSPSGTTQQSTAQPSGTTQQKGGPARQKGGSAGTSTATTATTSPSGAANQTKLNEAVEPKPLVNSKPGALQKQTVPNPPSAKLESTTPSAPSKPTSPGETAHTTATPSVAPHTAPLPTAHAPTAHAPSPPPVAHAAPPPPPHQAPAAHAPSPPPVAHAAPPPAPHPAAPPAAARPPSPPPVAHAAPPPRPAAPQAKKCKPGEKC
jgi:uncharacterized caspase-like protein